MGQKSLFIQECLDGGYIGVDFDLDINLTGQFPDRWQDFNQKYRSVWMERNPGRSKISAGLACGGIWVLSKGIQTDDIVLCSDGSGAYHVAVVTGDYQYVERASLPHQRPVRWLGMKIQRSEMSQALKNSSGSVGTCCDLSKYGAEIESLLGDIAPPALIATDQDVEDASVFALEKHLEDFLISNWQNTELSKQYDIYEEDGEIGQQYQTDTGPIDILAISKDRKELLVIELKKGRASDVVVGQIQRYMGYCLDELAEDGQTVKGVIIALEDDLKLKRALRVTNGIEFYRYQVKFELIKE